MTFGTAPFCSAIHSETCANTQANTAQGGSKAPSRTEGCESPNTIWAISDGHCGVCTIYNLLGRYIHQKNFNWKVHLTAAQKAAIRGEYQRGIAKQQEATLAEATKQRHSAIQKAWEGHVAFLFHRDMLELQHNLTVLEGDWVYTLKVRRECEGELLIVTHIESLEEFKKFERDFAMPDFAMPVRKFASYRFLKLDPSPPVVKAFPALFLDKPKNLACCNFYATGLPCGNKH
ncbi:hypothetical protein IFR05_011537 [Cadophora sp. M221]|nr:hypothetical protein IFR05_011537 [Cadophora sp. M221]